MSDDFNDYMSQLEQAKRELAGQKIDCTIILHETDGRIPISDKAMQGLADLAKDLSMHVFVISHLPTEAHRIYAQKMAEVEFEQAIHAFGLDHTPMIHIGADINGLRASLKQAEESFMRATPSIESLSLRMRNLAKRIEVHKEPPMLAAPKPYLQRKFHTVPGSRQDKYSRKR